MGVEFFALQHVSKFIDNKVVNREKNSKVYNLYNSAGNSAH